MAPLKQKGGSGKPGKHSGGKKSGGAGGGKKGAGGSGKKGGAGGAKRGGGNYKKDFEPSNPNAMATAAVKKAPVTKRGRDSKKTSAAAAAAAAAATTTRYDGKPEALAKQMEQRKQVLLDDGGRHLATKISKDLAHSVVLFKSKLLKLTYGSTLDDILNLVSPQMTQHLAPEISKYRSYLARFGRGSGGNHVLAYMKWYEWACFEAGKHDKYDGPASNSADAAADEREARTALGQLARDRKHVRALLAMCARHNSSRRVEGVHALLNLVRSESRNVSACRTLEELKGTAPTSIAYAVSRLVLSMATENFANVVLHCHTLSEVLRASPLVTTTCMLDVISTELSMAARMKAAELRMRAAAKKRREDGEDDGDQPLREYNSDDDIDPDDIADPTVGERHQKTMACIFSLVAILGAGRALTPAEASQFAKLLAHCYIEHKGLRVLTANVLLRLVREHPQVLAETASVTWITFAFFKFERVDYLRPEGIQFLAHLMGLHGAGVLPAEVARHTPAAIAAAFKKDALEPSTLESLASALFRKEQVTACHPNVHPVWDQFLALIEVRAAQGESLKNHVTNFVHNVISPFRRGNVELPRQDLFRALVQRVGQLGLRAIDAEDREQAIGTAASVGFGKRMAVGKPTPPTELRATSIADLGDKCRSLIVQYENSLNDSGPSARRVRTWILRELKAIMLVEHREGSQANYGDDVARALFKFGFGRNRSHDFFNANKALYTLCALIARSFDKRSGTLRGREHTRCTIPVDEYAQMIIDLEDSNSARYTSARKHASFGKAREALLKALDPKSSRSVLFYEDSTMRVLLLLLFFVVSMDDPSNDVAKGLAEESVTDLCAFYEQGKLSELEVLYDVLMSFVMRPTAPMQVIPVLAALRPLAVSCMVRFARLIKTKRPIDMLVQPLVEAYGTNTREDQRVMKARKAAEKAALGEEADSGSEDENVDSAAGASDKDEEESDAEESSDEEGDEEATDADSATEEDAATDADDAAEEGEDAVSGDDDEESDDDEEWSEGEGMDTDDDEAAADTKASPEYLKNLEAMLGVDAAEAAAHVYPADQTNKEKSDIVRCITLSTRLATHMRTPLMIHILQVLLAVLRENVKVADDVIFNAAKASIETLHRCRNRYFGHWVSAASPTLLVLLADIQSYCRKLERSLIVQAKKEAKKDSEDAKTHAQEAARMRRRLGCVKRVALTTFHLMGYLAYKNHAGEATRVVLGEHYRMVFCDRGWDHKMMPQVLRNDMFHFRHGFAWCFLDAIVGKFEKLLSLDTARRAMSFIGACDAIKSMIPRIAGLPADLKEKAVGVMKRFFTCATLKKLYQAKHTMLFDYFGVLKMAVEYNRRLELDLDYIKALVNEVTDDDDIQITNATARHVAALESLLGMIPRVQNIKACVPQAMLHKQHATAWRRNKTRGRARDEKRRTTVETELLAIRNEEPTEEQREEKSENRKIMRRVDRAERERLRRERWDRLTTDEKDSARTTSKNRKQERIHKNHERKRNIHERRVVSLKKWRAEKLQTAVDNEDA